MMVYFTVYGMIRIAIMLATVDFIVKFLKWLYDVYQKYKK